MANALAGVRGGAIQVQGTINGYGERTGNCNLTTIIPNLTLKMGVRTLPDGRLSRLTSASNRIAEIVNFTPDPQAPYVGSSAFAHKAGLHVSAIARRKDAYEHIDPDAVGNGTRFVVSEMAGKATIDLKAKEIGLDLDGPALTSVIDELKRLEHEGYHFEAADGSLELLMRRATGWVQPFFELESYRVIVERGRRGPPRHRGHREAQGRRRADRPHRRGQRPGQRARRRGAGRHRLRRTRSWPRSTSPTSRSACSTRPRAPAPSPGC